MIEDYNFKKIKDIMHLLKHRYPMLLVDKFRKLPDGTAEGIKNVTFNEPFFNGHFPDEPVMPGVLILEAMAQTSGLSIAIDDSGDTEKNSKVCYYASVEKARFRKIVLPGDTLRIISKTLFIRRGLAKFYCEAFVGDNKTTEAELGLFLPN